MNDLVAGNASSRKDARRKQNTGSPTIAAKADVHKIFSHVTIHYLDCRHASMINSVIEDEPSNTTADDELV